MNVSIRKFEKEDIPNKVEWINNPENNRFLHYDLPLEIEKTEKWYDNNCNRSDRFDGIILVDDTPCGTIGLLSIDNKNQKAEFYIAMGDVSFKGKGVATQASKIMIQYAFENLKLNRVYLFTETDNIAAQKLFDRVGFKKEGCLINDIFFNNKFVDRFVYGINRENWAKGEQ